MNPDWNEIRSDFDGRDVVDRDVLEVSKKLAPLHNPSVVESMGKYELVSLAQEAGAILERYNLKLNALDAAYKKLQSEYMLTQNRLGNEAAAYERVARELQNTKQLVVKLAAAAGQSHIFDEEWAKK